MRKTEVFGDVRTSLIVFAAILAAVLLCGTSAHADFTGTIALKADGTVDPADAPVTQQGKTYTLTDNVLGGIVVELSEITLDGAGNTLQKVASGANDGIALDSLSDVTITGFKIRDFVNGIFVDDSAGNTFSGNEISGTHFSINLQGSDNNTVSENTISGTDYGVHLDASDGNTIGDNTVSDTAENGIGLQSDCHYNFISGNTVSGGDENGISVGESSDNTVSGNIVSDNHHGIWVRDSANNAISGNTVSGNSYGIYLYGSSSNTVELNTLSGNTVAGVYLAGTAGSVSSNNVVSRNMLSDNYAAIHLTLYSEYNTIQGNTVSGNDYGIRLYSSDNNTIAENAVAHNNRGIRLLDTDDNGDNSSGNHAYHNNIVENVLQQGYDKGGDNTWHDGQGQGNYWSDYTGADDGSGGRTAGDGVGDTLLPWSGVDDYPLMHPWAVVDAIDSLLDTVEAMGLPHGIETSLSAKLENAKASIAGGDYGAAANKLGAFINQVEALRGKIIPGGQADQLVAAAQWIISSLVV